MIFIRAYKKLTDVKLAIQLARYIVWYFVVGRACDMSHMIV